MNSGECYNLTYAEDLGQTVNFPNKEGNVKSKGKAIISTTAANLLPICGETSLENDRQSKKAWKDVLLNGPGFSTRAAWKKSSDCCLVLAVLQFWDLIHILPNLECTRIHPQGTTSTHFKCLPWGLTGKAYFTSSILFIIFSMSVQIASVLEF